MQTRSSSSASPDLSPVVKFPADRRRVREAQLQIVDPTSSASTNASVDTYFIEPGTGRQFQSQESVQRHLIGEVNNKRITRAGVVFNENTRVYEGSGTKQAHRSLEYASKGFRLPKGWTVEEFPRSNSSQIDKYYVERNTGKRLRSLVSVERYLKESEQNRTDQQLMLLQYHRGISKSKDFTLPDGWIVEEKPRRNSSHIDRSYIEPGTGNKFRSMAAVERYLKAAGNATVDAMNSMLQSERLFLLANRNDSGFKAEVIHRNPPKKVKWVLTGPGGDMFSAKMSGSDVSGSVKQKWSEAFVLLIRHRY